MTYDPIWWREEHAHDVTCSPPGSSPFGGKLQPTPNWPIHDFHIQKQSCYVLCGAWHYPGHTQSFVQNARHPTREAYYRGEAWCSVGGWGFYPAPTVHSSHCGGWHPKPWLRAHGYYMWVGCTHLTVFPLVCGAHEHDTTVKQLEARLITNFISNNIPLALFND